MRGRWREGRMVVCCSVGEVPIPFMMMDLELMEDG